MPLDLSNLTTDARTRAIVFTAFSGRSDADGTPPREVEPVVAGTASLSEAEMEQLRRRVDAAPADHEASLDALAAFLRGRAATDLGRAYAVFYWVATHIRYDVEGLRRGVHGDLSAEAVLRRRAAVCSGYSRLFQGLASRVGLQSLEVSGLSKGYGFSERGELGEHAWNAIQIDNAWYLVDPTWGAGHLNDEDRFVFARRDFYFAPSPKQLIYSHLPEDARRQLLPAPLSRAAFEELPDLDPPFFELDLEWSQPVAAVSQVKDEQTLRFSTPQEIRVMVTLERDGTELPGHLVQVRRDGPELVVHGRYPISGRYTLRLFAKPASQQGPLPQAARLVVQARATHRPNGLVGRLQTAWLRALGSL